MRKTVDEIVLAPVRLIGDHDDVAPVREQRVRVARGVREKLLDRREDHTARCDPQLLPQVRPALRLHRCLAQQVLAARECPEQLVVQIISIGQRQDRRVGHRRMQDDLAGIERHGQALARPLCMPDHAHPPVALRPRRFDCRLERRVDRVELVVARELLDQPATALVLEHDEMPDEIEKPPVLE
jgi:hypothetical protein